MNQELYTYVQQQLQNGVSETGIRQALLQNGWDEQAINEVLPLPQATAVSTNTPSAHNSKALIIVGAAALALIIGAAAYFLISDTEQTTEPPTDVVAEEVTKKYDDSDLALSVVNVPDEENMYYELTKLEELMPDFVIDIDKKTDLARGQNWDAAAAAEIVAEHQEMFAVFEAAAQLPTYQNPETADPSTVGFDTKLPSYNSFREAAVHYAIYANYLAKQGNDDEAMNVAFNIVKVGHAIESAQDFRIEYLVALAIKSSGLDAMQNIISESDLPSSSLLAYATNLEKYRSDVNNLLRNEKLEYHFYTSLYDRIAAGDEQALQFSSFNEESIEQLSDTRYFDPEETKSYMADVTRYIIEELQEPCWTTSEPIDYNLLQKISDDDLENLDALVGQNPIGKVIHLTISTSMLEVKKRNCNQEAKLTMTQTLLGIKAYVIENGTYPETIAEITPEYLTETPLDPYDGTPIKYNAEMKLLYSIGEDRIDDGGTKNEVGNYDRPDLITDITF